MMLPARILARHIGPDGLTTPTSSLQTETEDVIQTTISQVAKPLVLHRMIHFNYLKILLFQGLSGAYKSQDSSQPWLLYWLVQSFQLLGAGLDPQTKQRAINTIMKCQHESGGFGGGPLQLPAILPTYAAVSALAVVGRPGPGGGWDQIDREKLYNFFMSLKQPDGSFIVSRNAEVDVRGIYCLLVTATLLDILTPELVKGTASFIASTQTYEGGFASSSMPYYSPDGTVLDEPRPTIGEAHGGYAGCAIGSWALLLPFIKEEKINLPNFLRWLVMMQGEKADGGGFRGRSNKLVDGCYSWWCGGALAVAEALFLDQEEENEEDTAENNATEQDDGWEEADEGFLNKGALQEYILAVAQDPAGGLRDKPSKIPDIYHTFYAIAGLSAAQHRVYKSKKREQSFLEQWKDSPAFIPSKAPEEDDASRQARRKAVWASSRSWKEDEGGSKFVGGPSNRVNALHPVFTLLVSQSDAILNHFYGQNTNA